ncbi:MAG: TIGR04283 family arsenosugar biosynthesis glycosyltransferase [Vicinamibacteria bacterium]|nr:TIGR04283 family arsenosugar biosynthesis glycosyltransferase [Vicinamibacteria bacterium]
MKLSIIVPVLNEAMELPRLLQDLASIMERGSEVIVADGGSSDDSAAIAQRFGCTVESSPRGRARQMNAGAKRATGDALLFLHADTRLPDDAVTLVANALENGRHAWGRFDVRIDGAGAMLRLVAWMMNGRSRLTSIATGDQAIFVTRAAFDEVRGFPDQPLMEDVELSKRLRRVSPPACITERVSTSARRWEARGVWRTILLMWRLRFDYWRGVPPSVLAEAYR